MSTEKDKKLAVFEGKRIRKTLHNEVWWFVIVDVVAALTDSANPSGYLRDMRRRDFSLAEAFQGGGQFAPPPCLGIIRGRNTINGIELPVIGIMSPDYPGRKRYFSFLKEGKL